MNQSQTQHAWALAPQRTKTSFSPNSLVTDIVSIPARLNRVRLRVVLLLALAADAQRHRRSPSRHNSPTARNLLGPAAGRNGRDGEKGSHNGGDVKRTRVTSTGKSPEKRQGCALEITRQPFSVVGETTNSESNQVACQQECQPITISVRRSIAVESFGNSKLTISSQFYHYLGVTTTISRVRPAEDG